MRDSDLLTADRLTRYVALMSVIAVRLYQLTMAGRTDPESSCAEHLSEKEWKVLFAHFNRTKSIPRKPPGTREAIRWLGMLGGHHGRKSDDPPGPTVIWRGLDQLQSSLFMAEAINALR